MTHGPTAPSQGLLSVIVPTRDRERHLTRCLTALHHQRPTGVRLQIIVVNDGTPGLTERVVDRVQRTATPNVSEHIGPQDLPSVRVIATGREEGQPAGVNRARNQGLEAADGDPIAFLDDDIEVAPDWAARLLRTVTEHPEAGCIGGPYVLHATHMPLFRCGRDHLEHLSFPPTQIAGVPESDEKRLEAPRAVDEVWGANFTVRRWAVQRIGPFDELLSGAGDEIEWQLRLRRSGGEILYDPGLEARHWRDEEELRLSSLVRSKFARERTRPQFWLRLASGPPRLLVQAVKSQTLAIRCLLHAVRYRCHGGLIDASGYFGLSLGCLDAMIQRPTSSREAGGLR